MKFADLLTSDRQKNIKPANKMTGCTSCTIYFPIVKGGGLKLYNRDWCEMRTWSQNSIVLYAGLYWRTVHITCWRLKLMQTIAKSYNSRDFPVNMRLNRNCNPNKRQEEKTNLKVKFLYSWLNITSKCPQCSWSYFFILFPLLIERLWVVLNVFFPYNHYQS